MSPEKPTYRGLLEQEIGLLDGLAAALTAAKAAIVSCKIEELEESTLIQQHLCAQLETAHAEMRRVSPQAAGEGHEEEKVAELRARWQKGQAILQQLNKEVQGVLWRSQKTVNALVNAFRMLEGSYAAEALKQAVRSSAIQERA
jgi:flagellar biosynthesis/type III secretory pathway chaperone